MAENDARRCYVNDQKLEKHRLVSFTRYRRHIRLRAANKSAIFLSETVIIVKAFWPRRERESARINDIVSGPAPESSQTCVCVPHIFTKTTLRCRAPLWIVSARLEREALGNTKRRPCFAIFAHLRESLVERQTTTGFD